mmetsp:Transcript_25898/g.29606  ORF Transcript_25898/g.29606 Transcript_25898/m.29606 type:complete len:391 (-) Transcript_25898:319-1491(-)
MTTYSVRIAAPPRTYTLQTMDILLFVLLFLLSQRPAFCFTCTTPQHLKNSNKKSGIHKLLTSTSRLTNLSSAVDNDINIGPRISIDDTFPGLTKIYSNPDVYIIKNFLDETSCEDLINKATEKKLDQSPVAYAGKNDDRNELLDLAAKGPVAWFSILSAWFQIKDESAADIVQLGLHTLQNYAVLFIVAAAGITLFIDSRADSLQSLRTSTSTTLDNLDDSSSGTVRFVKQAANLFNESNDKQNPARHAQYFEAPTVIRYEAEQVLAPHFDANKAAATEDANRGGQTLATLLVYLNDVEKGGNTRFGRLPTANSSNMKGNVVIDEDALTVKPKAGDALLFFPADIDGSFDERLEHEGCVAIDTKWIARIWRHIDRVPPPFGMSNSALSRL